eukprot:TRINITY_DN51215_c0_g1_i1.p1 TRINITY_DN51215_c0_g1~~TRINITY_DN51215_c0_g1_i1.p1  ORF type:complete len:336 (-),score=58.03 TRINITY_DN51215_c0_g1_i1:762-1655(-)
MAAARSRPQPKLIALDGNGTLLRSDAATISDYTKEVIHKVQALGIHVVMVTGRAFAKAKPFIESAGMNKYVITENGARAVRVSDGEVLHATWVDGEEAARPANLLRKAYPGRCHFVQLTSEGGIIEEAHPWLQEESQKEVADHMFKVRTRDILDVLHKGRQCAKAYVTLVDCHDFNSAMLEIKSVLGEDWQLREIKQLIPGIKNTTEVQSARVNKADGLTGLCSAIGLSPANVWAFGDEVNDQRMLTEMGWGVRMANHSSDLESVGDDVTEANNDEDGVAKYLDKYILQAGLTGTTS